MSTSEIPALISAKTSRRRSSQMWRSVGRLLPQFLKFAVVGTIGFIADTATVYAVREVAGVYAAGFAGSAISLSITWPLNRHWTFAGAGRAIYREFPLYITTTLLALVLNRSVFLVLVTSVPLCTRQPVFAVAAGSVAGMFINFFLNRSVVFRARA